MTNTPGVQPLSVDRSSQRIKSGDDGDVVWYWVAPEKFLGDQRSFFHGVLHYTLGHYMYNEAGGGVDRHGDIILESASHRLVLEVGPAQPSPGLRRWCARMLRRGLF